MIIRDTSRHLEDIWRQGTCYREAYTDEHDRVRDHDRDLHTSLVMSILSEGKGNDQ
jgi:hypothetical protein